MDKQIGILLSKILDTPLVEENCLVATNAIVSDHGCWLVMVPSTINKYGTSSFTTFQKRAIFVKPTGDLATKVVQIINDGSIRTLWIDDFKPIHYLIGDSIQNNKITKVEYLGNYFGVTGSENVQAGFYIVEESIPEKGAIKLTMLKRMYSKAKGSVRSLGKIFVTSPIKLMLLNNSTHFLDKFLSLANDITSFKIKKQLQLFKPEVYGSNLIDIQYEDKVKELEQKYTQVYRIPQTRTNSIVRETAGMAYIGASLPTDTFIGTESIDTSAYYQYLTVKTGYTSFIEGSTEPVEAFLTKTAKELLRLLITGGITAGVTFFSVKGCEWWTSAEETRRLEQTKADIERNLITIFAKLSSDDIKRVLASTKYNWSVPGDALKNIKSPNDAVAVWKAIMLLNDEIAKKDATAQQARIDELVGRVTGSDDNDASSAINIKPNPDIPLEKTINKRVKIYTKQKIESTDSPKAIKEKKRNNKKVEKPRAEKADRKRKSQEITKRARPLDYFEDNEKDDKIGVIEKSTDNKVKIKKESIVDSIGTNSDIFDIDTLTNKDSVVDTFTTTVTTTTITGSTDSPNLDSIPLDYYDVWAKTNK